MTTFLTNHWGFHRRHKKLHAKRDQAKEQLHHERMTALVVLSVMALVFAAIIALAAISGAPPDGNTVGPWMMP